MNASVTEKLLNSSHSTGESTIPRACKPWLTTPLRPSSGTHEIMRITLLVQNGTVQSRNKSVCVPTERTWKARKYASVKPITSVNAQTVKQNLKVDRYVFSVTHMSPEK